MFEVLTALGLKCWKFNMFGVHRILKKDLHSFSDSVRSEIKLVV